MIDVERLKELRELMDDDFLDLIDIFFDDTRERFSELQRLFSQTSVDDLAIRMEAHTLKGSCGNLFAGKLKQLFFEIERMAFEERLEEKGDLIQQIETELDVVFKELAEFNQLN